jgi:hypothetical protein
MLQQITIQKIRRAIEHTKELKNTICAVLFFFLKKICFEVENG